MNRFFLNVLQGNLWLLVILYFLLSFLIRYTDLEFVKTDELYYEFLADKAENKYDDYNEYIEDFEEELNDLEDDSEDSYLVEDLLADVGITAYDFISSIVVTALLLMAGFQLNSQMEALNYAIIFKAVLLGKFAFFVKSALSIFWFLFMKQEYTFAEVVEFHPLSLYSLFDANAAPTWLHALLRVVNVFQVLFCIITSYCLYLLYRVPFSIIIKWVMVIYFSIVFIREAIWIYIDLSLL